MCKIVKIPWEIQNILWQIESYFWSHFDSLNWNRKCFCTQQTNAPLFFGKFHKSVASCGISKTYMPKLTSIPNGRNTKHSYCSMQKMSLVNQKTWIHSMINRLVQTWFALQSKFLQHSKRLTVYHYLLFRLSYTDHFTTTPCCPVVGVRSV